MLSRRILRVKAFKVLYSYAEDQSLPLKEALVRLEDSCEAVRDLYVYMLSIIPVLTAEAARRIEAASRIPATRYPSRARHDITPARSPCSARWTT